MAKVEEISMSLVKEFLNRKVIRLHANCCVHVRYPVCIINKSFAGSTFDYDYDCV